METTTMQQLFFSLTFATLISLIHSATLKSDIHAIRNLKQYVDPNTIASSSYLSSSDPCESTKSQFLGILCTINSGNSPSRIIQLELGVIGYDGFLTESISNLTELTVLNLSRNKFHGPVPNSIASLKKLTILSLSDNFFTGGFPARITKLKKLQVVDLARNNLRGTVPANVASLHRLIVLGLANNAFTGRIPDLTGLWQLHTLDLASNLFYGTLPKVLAGLRTLSPSHNLLVGHITPIRALRHLGSLDLSDNRFSGRIASEILSLTQLVHFNTSFNCFTSLEVDKFNELDSRLQVLDAHENHLPAICRLIWSLLQICYRSILLVISYRVLFR